MCRSRLPIPAFVRFLWLVLTWSLLCAPRLLGGEPDLGLLVPPQGPGEIAPGEVAALVPPLPVEPSSTLQSEPQPAVLPSAPAAAAWQPCYWSVSSRNSAQHPREWDGCPLDVFYRSPDGRLYRSNIPSLAASLTPGAPVLICIHGSFVSSDDNIKESAEAFENIRAAAPNLPLHIIFYTWPSDGPYTLLPAVDIAIRGDRAEFNGFHIAWLMSNISEDHPICLLGHSHGCRTVMSTLQLVSGGSIHDYCFTGYKAPSRRMRAVMAAAAFDHNWLNPGQRYDRALPRVECVLNLQNQKDLPLAFYPITRPFAHRAIARSGLTWRDRTKLGAQSAKVADCDVTHLLGHAHYWPEYYSRPQILSVAAPYVYFVTTAR